MIPGAGGVIPGAGTPASTDRFLLAPHLLGLGLSFLPDESHGDGGQHQVCQALLAITLQEAAVQERHLFKRC